MRFFADEITLPIIEQRLVKHVLEIGASYGNNTKMLLSNPKIQLSIVDPCLDLDLVAEFGDRVYVHKGLSLDVLPCLSQKFDCIFIDGDHNWYTVFNELVLIEKHRLLSPDGIVFLHDVAWPYGRRDLYYQPEVVPSAFRQPHAMKGMERGRSKLLDSGGFNDGLWNAIDEGGPRNGVLTAVEDFLRQSDNRYCLIVDDRQWGLGILFRRSAKNAKALERQLRSQIFRRKHIEPKVMFLRGLVHRAKSSKLANALRVVRNRIWRSNPNEH